MTLGEAWIAGICRCCGASGATAYRLKAGHHTMRCDHCARSCCAADLNGATATPGVWPFSSPPPAGFTALRPAADPAPPALPPATS